VSLKEAYHHMTTRLSEGHTTKNVVVHCTTWKKFATKLVLHKDMFRSRRKYHGLIVRFIQHLPSFLLLFIKLDMSHMTKREVVCNVWLCHVNNKIITFLNDILRNCRKQLEIEKLFFYIINTCD